MSSNRPSFDQPTFGGSDNVSIAARQDANSSVPTVEQIQDLSNRIQALELKSSRRINLNTEIVGLFEVVSSAPTGTPKEVFDQIKIYVSGGTYRLYVYDYNGHAWHYASLT
jgi:hypothetical protein